MKQYVEKLSLKTPPEEGSYYGEITAIRQLLREPLCLTGSVTFLVGENGTGKSTLLEALAVALGYNAEGGSRNLRYTTAETHSPLWEHLRVTRSCYRPRDGFFLRAESFYNMATGLDSLEDPQALRSYGGVSLHTRSHGESFLALVQNRFGGQGLYLLDEPEAALSPARQMTLLVEMDRLVRADSQLIIATHSPILMAYPHAQIIQLSEEGFREIPYRETEHYCLTKLFLDDPGRMLHHLLGESSD